MSSSKYLKQRADELFVQAGMWDEQQNTVEADKCRATANELLNLSTMIEQAPAVEVTNETI